MRRERRTGGCHCVAPSPWSGTGVPDIPSDKHSGHARNEAKLAGFFFGIDAAFDFGHSFAVPNDDDCDQHGGDGDNGNRAHAGTEDFGTQDSIKPLGRLGLGEQKCSDHACWA
jgi:hypothetical protein